MSTFKPVDRDELRARFVTDELERRNLTTDKPEGEREFIDRFEGYLCTASGCLERRTDSYGECIECGEPVVKVWTR